MSKEKQPTNISVAVIYARYSSVNQRDVSIEQQVAACQKYAESQGLTVLRVYDDHAMTGTNDNRPSFRQMISDSSVGTFSYVIVYSLDRFSRNKYDAVSNKKTLRDNGVKVLSATEHITDDPTGVLMESILEGFAEYYSKELSQKIMRGNRSNAEKCMVFGRPPFGYKKGADGKFEIVPEEAAIVQEIFRRVAAREAFADIFRDLNERGIKTKSKVDWNRSSLNKLLHNKKYIGIYEYHDSRNGFDDIFVRDGVPRIIDDVLFERVQEYCKEKPQSRNNPKRRMRENGMYILTGKLFCGSCKAPMVGVSGTSKSGKLFSYYCCKNHRDNPSSCQKKQVQRDEIEGMIASKIQELISQPAVVEWLADGVIKHLHEIEKTDETNLLKERLEVIDHEKRNILNNMQKVTLDILINDLQQNYEKLSAEESSLKAKLLVAEAKKKKDITREHVIAFAEEFSKGNIEDKRYQESLIDAFLVGAYLYDDRFKLIINCAGEANEIEIPTILQENIDNIEETSLSDNESGGVRIRTQKWSLEELIRTRMTVLLIEGLAVVVNQFH